jgi:hypothetical protein
MREAGPLRGPLTFYLPLSGRGYAKVVPLAPTGPETGHLTALTSQGIDFDAARATCSDPFRRRGLPAWLRGRVGRRGPIVGDNRGFD